MSTSSHQLTIVADLTYRQVDFWTRAGYLTTLDDPTPGTGHPRAFDDDQVALAVQMSRLTKIGLPANVAAEIGTQILTTGRATADGYQILPTHGMGDPICHPLNVHHINRSGDAA